MAEKSTVLVPLYIYPLTEKTWKPLYDAISTHSELDFLVIVNPNSGPGESQMPDVNYGREVPRLNSLANVCTVGYVRINYCDKPLSELYEEIDKYAGWAENYDQTGLGVHGIFLDETPNHYSPRFAEYLEQVRGRVKGTSGILGDRLVIHNPGTPPDPELADPGPDVILVCEEPFDRYRGDEVQQRLSEFPYHRERSGYMLSGAPGEDIQQLVQELRPRGKYLFVTELVEDFYESFGTSWGDFMDAMGAMDAV